MQHLLDQFKHHLVYERGLSPFTVRNYATDIQHFISFLQAEEIDSLEAVNSLAVRNYLGQLLDAGTVRGSISRKMSALRAFYRYLNREGITPNQPLATVSAPKMEKRLPSFLTSEQILSLMQTPDVSTPHGVRDRAMLELLYASGMRISEIVSLDVNSVDLDTLQIRVRGKGSKERMVLIGEPAAGVLADYLQYARLKLAGPETTDALFLNRYGRRIAHRRIQYIVKKYAKQAGITEHVHPHTVRHTFATHMLDGGADLRVVQELLGHSNLSSTQVYTHVTRSQMRSRYLDAHPRGAETQRKVLGELEARAEKPKAVERDQEPAE